MAHHQHEPGRADPSASHAHYPAAAFAHQLGLPPPAQAAMFDGAPSHIPSLVPAHVDPGSVDFRTFFPYVPNKVKHRKRTSRVLLKRLEEVFAEHTKPPLPLRAKLADELGMTPRSVQVRAPVPCAPPRQPPLTPRWCTDLVPEPVRHGPRVADSAPGH
jgi:hypothetical protein